MASSLFHAHTPTAIRPAICWDSGFTTCSGCRLLWPYQYGSSIGTWDSQHVAIDDSLVYIIVYSSDQVIHDCLFGKQLGGNFVT